MPLPDGEDISCNLNNSRAQPQGCLESILGLTQCSSSEGLAFLSSFHHIIRALGAFLDEALIA